MIKQLETIEKNLAAILKIANDFNYYGKRIRDSRLEVTEGIVKSLALTLDAVYLMEYLNETKPEKVEKKRADSNKLAASTMLGNETAQAQNLPTITGRKFVITTAQNNTLPASIFSLLEKASIDLQAELIVMPCHYNKNAFSAAVDDENEFFDPAFQPYLLKADSWLFEEQFARLSMVRIIPTVKYPVNSAQQANTGELITIVASPKQQLRTLPSLAGDAIKEAWSTGCSTQYNYTDTKAGRDAQPDHVFGGILVEILPDETIAVTNLRQADDGSLVFIDSDCTRYAYNETIPQKPVAILGDLHCEMFDPESWRKSISWLQGINPQLIAAHDVLHFSTRSHHNRSDSKHLYKTRNESVFNDLKQVIDQLNELANIAPVYVVESNHNSAIDNWLSDTGGSRIAFDTHNAKIYYLLNWLVCDSLDNGVDKNALQIALENCDLTGLPEMSPKIYFGSMDESEKHFGYDLSHHGHKGQNGSMGSHNLLHKWQLKLVTGHTHSPAITGSVLTVGLVARMKQGYNKGGASSWQQSNGIVHSNGVAQIAPMNPQTI
jgi:hypothetical protein